MIRDEYLINWSLFALNKECWNCFQDDMVDSISKCDHYELYVSGINVRHIQFHFGTNVLKMIQTHKYHVILGDVSSCDFCREVVDLLALCASGQSLFCAWTLLLSLLPTADWYLSFFFFYKPDTYFSCFLLCFWMCVICGVSLCVL